MIYQILAALFLGSGLASVFARLAIKHSIINFFNKEIPSLTPEIVQFKNYDLIEFGLALILSFLIFWLNYFLLKTKKDKKLVNIFYLAFAFLVFLETQLTEYSAKTVFSMVVFGQFYFLILSFGHFKKPKIKPIHIANSFLTGFYFLLLSNLITVQIWWPLLFFVSTIFFYLLFSSACDKYIRSPAHLLFSIAIVFPDKLIYIVILGIVVFVLIFLVRERKVFKWIYPPAIIFLLFYNPLFYVGNFDTVEEGFWLAWIQRILNGQVLYRDVAVYHPPIITWLMFTFMKATEFSIFQARLFLHLAQIIGLIIYWFFVNKIIKRPINKFVLMFLVFCFTQTMVRNNVEIRLGMALIPLMFWLNYLESKKIKWLIFSGILSALSFFVSYEVGIAVFSVIAISILLFLKEKVKKATVFSISVGLGAMPVIFYLFIRGALSGFISQFLFYSQSFSTGYMNIPVEQAIKTSFFRWHLFYEYLSSTPWFWEMIRMILFAFLILLGLKWVKEKRLLVEEKFLISCSLFSLFLFRVALGRSDWEHLLFTAFICLPLFFYMVESYLGGRVVINVFVILIIFIFTRNWLTSAVSYPDRFVFQLQTYARPMGEHQPIRLDRAKIFFDKEVKIEDYVKTIEYISQETKLEDTIFAYPWMPELYFLTNRKNATFFDVPLAFFTEYYQKTITEQLLENEPKYIVYEPRKGIAGLSVESLQLVNRFIKENYETEVEFGIVQILKCKKNI